MSKKKKPVRFIWRELTDEEALKKFGGSFIVVGRGISLSGKPRSPKKRKDTATS